MHDHHIEKNITTTSASGTTCPSHIDNNKLDSSNSETPPPRCCGCRPSSSCACLLEVPVKGLVGPVGVGGQVSPAGSARAGMVLLALGLAAAASVLLLGGRNWGGGAGCHHGMARLANTSRCTLCLFLDWTETELMYEPDTNSHSELSQRVSLRSFPIRLDFLPLWPETQSLWVELDLKKEGWQSPRPTPPPVDAPVWSPRSPWPCRPTSWPRSGASPTVKCHMICSASRVGQTRGIGT